MSGHRHDLPKLVPGELSFEEGMEWIRSADRVLIGAGAGLSAAAGFDYGDTERFQELFPALYDAGFRARYQLIGYPLSPRMQWGFWAVHVHDIRLGAETNPVYQDLRHVVGDREHFVLSSNVDALFTRNGFDPSRVWTPQGDYALYQCLTPCTRQVWDARAILAKALQDYDPATGQTSEAAVPTCPNCGGPVSLNVFAGRWYINDHFAPQLDALNDWLQDSIRADARVAIIEIGSGFNTPGVIRWPIERVAENLPNARLIRINREHPDAPEAISHRSASLGMDAAELLHTLATKEGPIS